MAAVIQQSYDGILVTDNNANVVMANDAYFRITDIKKEELIGKNFREFTVSKSYTRIACLDVLEKKSR